MGNNLSVAQTTAISERGSSAARQITDGKSAASDENWFSLAARRLYPDKAGTILFITTGLGDERLCQRYAAGHVQPKAYFLRALLRGDHGRQWLFATMDGCAAPWWRELVQQAEVGAKVLQITKSPRPD